MITKLDVEVIATQPLPDYFDLDSSICALGDFVGRKTYGDGWEKKLYPSEEKFRIHAPPKLFQQKLEIQVAPYQWSELQKRRQVQPIGKRPDSDPYKFLLNAVTLTANGIIETSDRHLIFHRKKGGAKQGSIHAFGGYVSKKDIESGGVRSTIKRELMESFELGLKENEFSVEDLFGTPDGMPAILWDYGTAAVYAVAKISMTAEELQKRLEEISSEETIDKELVAVRTENVRNLLQEENIHPQTKQVTPTIIELYKK